MLAAKSHQFHPWPLNQPLVFSSQLGVTTGKAVLVANSFKPGIRSVFAFLHSSSLTFDEIDVYLTILWQFLLCTVSVSSAAKEDLRKIISILMKLSAAPLKRIFVWWWRCNSCRTVSRSQILPADSRPVVQKWEAVLWQVPPGCLGWQRCRQTCRNHRTGRCSGRAGFQSLSSACHSFFLYKAAYTLPPSQGLLPGWILSIFWESKKFWKLTAVTFWRPMERTKSTTGKRWQSPLFIFPPIPINCWSSPPTQWLVLFWSQLMEARMPQHWMLCSPRVGTRALLSGAAYQSSPKTEIHRNQAVKLKPVGSCYVM